ncbi:hypothetical protein MKX01_025702 [Papaver californicum]|nr:hypothetical protein MKX01_025702 [Papaver californicum]
MNAALCYTPPPPPSLRLQTTSFSPSIFTPKLQTTVIPRRYRVKAIASESLTPRKSTSHGGGGGEACNVEMYPEAKPKPENKSTAPKTTKESVDREVFPAEACDDLSGEFLST